MLDINEIQKILPQRYPFIMIDRVIEFEKDAKLVAIKNVTANEEFFVGHFPEKPVMPGVLITEAMAQAAILFYHESKLPGDYSKKIYYLRKISVEFLQPVVPGDQLKLVVTPVKIIKDVGIVNIAAMVEEKIVAKGEASFAVKSG